MKIKDWVEAERNRVKNHDWDNVMLFTGIEGTGKSTWMRQVMTALDDAFNVDRIHFRLDDFLGQAPKLARYSAIVWDEARLNKRRAMHGSTIDTLDFLQDCRGLNLHIGLCFPHEKLLDEAVKNHRIRWRWHVSRRGVVELKRRVSRTVGSRRGKFEVFDWQTVAGFYFKDDEGTELRVAYNAKKEAHMRRKEVTEELDLEGLGFDVAKTLAEIHATSD